MGNLIRGNVGYGFTPILKGDRGKAGLTFGILKLGQRAGQDETNRSGCGRVRRNANEMARSFSGDSGVNELGLIILGGRCFVEAGSEKWGPIGARENVFSGRATAVYVPPHTAYRISSVDEDEGGVEIAIAGVPCGGEVGGCGLQPAGEPQLVAPDQVVVNTRGARNFAREVHDIIASNVKAQKLVIGETFTPQGNWSSYPPHKHDVDDFPDEVKMEELYFFKVNPLQGFGVQVMYGFASGAGCKARSGGERYSRPCESAYIVRDNDAVLIEGGYHPVVAAPGYALYYLWVLAGETRVLVPRDDPDHAWVKEET